jgi:hypothetical protein
MVAAYYFQNHSLATLKNNTIDVCVCVSNRHYYWHISYWKQSLGNVIMQ